MKLIYCARPNRKYAEIAVKHGFFYGATLPAKIYHPPYMADQNWRDPNKEAYMNALDEHRPTIATVLDWERPEQFNTVMDWAEEASQYCENIIVIPKIANLINKIPKQINGKEIILGYSANTCYAGTPTPLWQFAGYPIHILGGSPRIQQQVYLYLSVNSTVVSTDSNCINKAASYGKYWKGKWKHSRDRKKDMIYRVFETSCINIIREWKEFLPQYDDRLELNIIKESI